MDIFYHWAHNPVVSLCGDVVEEDQAMSNVPTSESPKRNAERQLKDPRIIRTKLAVERALMDLLATGRPYAELTVSEVSAHAGVTRRTFYAHFSSVDEVVREIASSLFRAALAEVKDASFGLPLTGSGLGRAIFGHLHERSDMLVPLVTRCPSALFLEPARNVTVDVIFPRILGANRLGAINKFEREYLAHLAGAVLHAGITAWAERGFQDDPDAVADFLMTLLGPAADRVFGDAGE